MSAVGREKRGVWWHRGDMVDATHVDDVFCFFCRWRSASRYGWVPSRDDGRIVYDIASVGMLALVLYLAYAL